MAHTSPPQTDDSPSRGRRDVDRESPVDSYTPDAAESALIAALRSGDEDAYDTLVRRHHASLVRLARVWLRDGAAAEEVAQETWVAVLHGLDRFEGRSRLQSWIFSILVNQAKRRAARDRRTVSFSALGGDDGDAEGWSVDPDRFFGAGHPDAGHWNRPVTVRGDDPEVYLLSNEVSGRVLAAIEDLPANYRAVVTMRDIDGMSAEETCTSLGLTAANQRVLLHRARSRIRQVIEPYLQSPDEVSHAS
ncbi:MAG: RNA polymerase sigma factor RpoE [uncultured Thermomicrobiales bacterium]|uniref:RNA polymerase sigma factor RpoE n=1 Tax=uncultured Thermomicrobiales bacterium TaxID=1645740 RepID=A0A6J4UXX4_9BACT|nr:MAG: RNA polymerase sigma factor RpoE [uncultured Thermomicrobiales bacterium]